MSGEGWRTATVRAAEEALAAAVRTADEIIAAADPEPPPEPMPSEEPPEKTILHDAW